jgi:branched-subunit amino acid transport protein
MTTPWLVTAALGLVTMAIKGAGPVVLGGRRLPERAVAGLRLLAPALLAALIATQVFAADNGLIVDARAGGLVASIVALVLRAPALVVIGSAATATALIRLVT